MQVIKSKTVVKLSMQELEDAVRLYVDNKEGYWIDELELEVDRYEIVESEKVVSKNYEEGPDESARWKFVPPGWNKKQAPEKLERDAKLNLVFRTGRRVYDRDAAHLDFSQTGDSHDIIWYQLC